MRNLVDPFIGVAERRWWRRLNDSWRLAIDVDEILIPTPTPIRGISGKVATFAKAQNTAPKFSALLGVILSIAAWFSLAQWERRLAATEFNNRAEVSASLMQGRISDSLQSLYAVRALFDSAPSAITRGTFEIFAKEILRDRGVIQSISWVPRVVRETREAHERNGNLDGIGSYAIRAVGQNGTLYRAPERNEYFPVYYTINRQSLSVYGVNLGDGGLREDALMRARDRDDLASSGIFSLQSGVGDRRGFLVALPVFRKEMPHSTLEDRRRNLDGFVIAIVQTELLMGGFFERSPRNVFIFGPGGAPGSQPLYAHYAEPKASRDGHTVDQLLGGADWSSTLTVADQRWPIVMMRASTASPLGPRNALTLLVAGLLITAGVVAFMISSARHARRLARAHERSVELAQTDSLTKLPNRRAFLDHLGNALAACKRGAPPLAVLYFDLDHFKDVNDTQGHPTGDILLQQVSERLKSIVRSTDIVARFGGDEFAILQTDAKDIEATAKLAAKLVSTLAVPYSLNGSDAFVTASVGIARYSEELPSPEAILMRADLALYRAKEDGRNCFRFHTEDLDHEVLERVAIADDLRIALSREQFELQYQPQVDIRTGRIVGMEALIRWNHPTRGMVCPADFIPIAERSGCIIQIGKWVFNEACRQLRLWDDDGLALDRLAVNVSGVQCMQSDLGQDISEILAKWNINANRMEIELTESVLMEVTKENWSVIEQLRQIGLKLAIDDFGTGYSSLNYLTNYPVHRMKIAQELVFGVTTDARHASVVRTAVHLAQDLDIEVIAEGVETKAQADFLVSAGCDFAQGYHYSRPVTAERATEMLRLKYIGSGGRTAELCATSA